MAKRARQRWNVGDIVQIPLGGGRHGYGWILENPLVAFFSGVFINDVPAHELLNRPIIFEIWVHNDAVKQGVWPVVGHVDPPSHLLGTKSFFRQDAISGQLYLYSTFPSGESERPASVEECQGLEAAAVWDPEHVVSRLIDHEAGRPNVWVTSLKIDPSKIPSA